MMNMSLKLNSEIRYIKGVGPSTAEKLNRLGIEIVEDLIYYFPRDYEDRRNLKTLAETDEGEKATFHFKVIDQGYIRFNGRNHPKIKVTDSTGIAYLYCFNRSYLKDILVPGTSFYLIGKYSLKGRYPIFSSFNYELDDNNAKLGIIPVYRLTSGISQNLLRKIIKTVLDSLSDKLKEEIPEFIRKGYKIPPRGEIIKRIHFPPSQRELRRMREAYSYQEFFKYQLIVAMAKSKNKEIKKNRIKSSGELREKFLKKLPFKLTNAQNRVLSEIDRDLDSPAPMNRLIQGDVGSGKTIVSVFAALKALERNEQVAFMAPTEILARQHYNSLKEYLSDLNVKIEFLSSSVKGVKRKELVLKLLKGDVDIIVGTHALFSDDVEFRNLSLVIIDEQQKFGVLQRGKLRQKGKHTDCLVMSATPIPRTLSMTLYGDLDVSIIDEMPQGRIGTETHIVKQAEINKVYDFVKKEVSEGRQAYFIYPVIEESAVLDVKNATESFEYLNNEIFSEFNVALLHGRMSEEEKDKIMQEFKDRKYDILVSTTVVEVGVDIPNATVMVIEQAERFGLSNIHQLRGRIGRGKYKSYCFLIPDKSAGREAFNRLMILKHTNDGFKIAEWDLKLRGPGDIIGKKQAGLPSFIIDDIDINTKLIYRAQKDARKFVNGEIGTEKERELFLNSFIQSESYKRASLYFGG